MVVALVAFALLPLPFLDGEGYMDMALLWTSESDPLASIQASFGFDFVSNPVSQKKKKKKKEYKQKQVITESSYLSCYIVLWVLFFFS